MRVVNYHGFLKGDWANHMTAKVRLEATTPGWNYSRVWKGSESGTLVQDHKYKLHWGLLSDNLSPRAQWQVHVKLTWDRPFPTKNVVKDFSLPFNANRADPTAAGSSPDEEAAEPLPSAARPRSPRSAVVALHVTRLPRQGRRHPLLRRLIARGALPRTSGTNSVPQPGRRIARAHVPHGRWRRATPGPILAAGALVAAVAGRTGLRGGLPGAGQAGPHPDPHVQTNSVRCVPGPTEHHSSCQGPALDARRQLQRLVQGDWADHMEAKVRLEPTSTGMPLS